MSIQSGDVEQFIGELRRMGDTTATPQPDAALIAMFEGGRQPRTAAVAATRRRWLRPVVLPTTVATVLFGGLAAAGALPAPLQHATAGVVSHLGVSIPGHTDPAPHPASTRPATTPSATAPTVSTHSAGGSTRTHVSTTTPAGTTPSAGTATPGPRASVPLPVTPPTLAPPTLPTLPRVTVPGLPTVPTLPALPPVSVPKLLP